MGNCHTVGPNEALVVSGNVTERERYVSAPRVPSCLVELDEAFIGNIRENWLKKEKKPPMFDTELADSIFLDVIWADNSVWLELDDSRGFNTSSAPPREKIQMPVLFWVGMMKAEALQF